MEPILTDDKGRPFEKPERADYPDTTSYLRAFWAYKDAVAGAANAAFNRAFFPAIRTR